MWEKVTEINERVALSYDKTISINSKGLARLVDTKERSQSARELFMSKSYVFAAVLFDLDGVILDTTALHYRVWMEFGLAHGHLPTQAELVATNGVRAAETVQTWLGTAVNTEQAEAHAAELSEKITKMLGTETVPAVPGVQNFVTALAAAGIPRAVATSATPINAALSLSCVNLANSFGAIVTAADVTRGKPDPEPYLKAAAALGVSASRCVVFEDSVFGIRAAKAAGAKCAALATTFPRETLLAEQPDWLIADFLTVPAELRP